MEKQIKILQISIAILVIALGLTSFHFYSEVKDAKIKIEKNTQNINEIVNFLNSAVAEAKKQQAEVPSK